MASGPSPEGTSDGKYQLCRLPAFPHKKDLMENCSTAIVQEINLQSDRPTTPGTK